MRVSTLSDNVREEVAIPHGKVDCIQNENGNSLDSCEVVVEDLFLNLVQTVSSG